MITCLTHGDGIGEGKERVGGGGVGEAKRLGAEGSEQLVFTSWLIRPFDLDVQICTRNLIWQKQPLHV